jgi:hypothetical protein
MHQDVVTLDGNPGESGGSAGGEPLAEAVPIIRELRGTTTSAYVSPYRTSTLSQSAKMLPVV